jgi:tetratricopeptide (TPR) repeat protein
LFTEELVKALAGGESSGDTIPRTVRDLLAARLDGLDDTKGLAQTASVLGREIDVELLRDVSGLKPRQLDAGLAHLTGAGILEVMPSAPAPVTHQFVHALVRDAAYESQEQERRFRIHRRAAEALAIRPNADPGQVAQHFDAARATDEAVGWYLIGGAGAQAAAADAEAIRHLDRAYELVMAQPAGSPRDVTELNVHILRGTSHVNMRGYGAPGAASDFSRSLELSEQMTSGADVVPLTAAVWAYYLVHGDLRAADDAARRLEAMSTPEFEAEILCCLGAQRFFEGRIRESREYLEASVARFEGRPADATVALRWLLPSDPLAVALTHLGCVLWLVGDVAGATTRLDQAKERARSLPEYPRGAFTEAYVCSYAAWIAILAGRFEDGRALHEEASAIADRYGMLFWAVAGSSGRAIGLGFLGSPRDAIELLAPSLEQWRELGAGAFLPFVIAQRALLHLQLHQAEHALEDVDFALEHATRTSEDFFSAEAHRIRAAILLELDPQASEAARAELVMARDLAARQGALVFELRAALDLAELEHDDPHAVDAVRELVVRMHGAAGLAELERASTLLDA